VVNFFQGIYQLAAFRFRLP